MLSILGCGSYSEGTTKSKKQPDNEFVIGLEIGTGKREGGLSVEEFSEYAKIAERRHGPGVMVGQPSQTGRMNLTKSGKHLGYIDVITGSLIWDPVGKKERD